MIPVIEENETKHEYMIKCIDELKAKGISLAYCKIIAKQAYSGNIKAANSIYEKFLNINDEILKQ